MLLYSVTLFMDIKMSIIDKDTPIYQVCENDEQLNKNCNYENLESTSITFDDIKFNSKI